MPLRLELFDDGGDKADRAAKATVVTDAGALEEARLAAYEQGYTAGWDDAVAAQGEDQARLRADLARNLQGLAFTYHEARSHILRAIEPLFETILARILPDLARVALAPRVLEALAPLAAAAADTPVDLVLNPAARPAVEAALAEAPPLPLHIVEEPTLGEGQAYLRLGASETRIDLDRAVAEISAAIRGFFDTDRNGEPAP